MDTAFEQKYHHLEENHWWFSARRDCLYRFLRRLAVPTDAAILDVGCSGGALLSSLRTHGYSRVAGIDLSAIAVARCHQRGLTDVQVMDAHTPAFPPGHFDCLIASDILEHLAEPDAALHHWRQLLRSGGALLVFVPAFAFLWSAHDVVNHHHRRYTRATLCNQLRAAGFTVEHAGYWNTSLFAPIAALRILQRLRPCSPSLPPPRDDLHLPCPIINRALTTLLRLENRALAAGIPFPCGVSTWAIGKAPPAKIEKPHSLFWTHLR